MAESDARTAGRGFIVITAAKLWFMVGGAAINFGLPLILGDVGYGQYIDLNNTLSILSMVMITGVMQSVSKFVAERPEQSGGVARQALRMMLVVSTLVGGGFMLAAPYIADARQNPHLTLGYRFAGAILFFYGIYTVFIGVLNGRKQFLRQAKFDMLYTGIKAVAVLGLAAAGLGVAGAFGGFAIASAIICAIAALVVGRERHDGAPCPELYRFAAQVMLYTLVFNFVFKLDVLMLKPLCAEALGQVDASVIDSLTGQYGLAVNLARIPWQATLAIAFVIFPMISSATFENDRERARLYVRQTLRYTMILVVAPAVVLTALADHIILGVWKEPFAASASALVWLAPAYVAFSLFNVVNTILMSAGRATYALVIGVVTCSLAAGLYYGLLQGVADRDALIVRTSIATLIAFVVGLALGAGALWRIYGPPFPFGTSLRTLGLGAGLVLAGWQIPRFGGIIGAALLAVVFGLGFIVLLFVVREFGQEDKERLMKIIKR